MTKQEKIIFLEELMDLEDGTLKEDTMLEDLDEWDSLSKLSLVSEAKDQFGKTLTINEIRDFKTVDDICEYLS